MSSPNSNVPRREPAHEPAIDIIDFLNRMQQILDHAPANHNPPILGPVGSRHRDQLDAMGSDGSRHIVAPNSWNIACPICDRYFMTEFECSYHVDRAHMASELPDNKIDDGKGADDEEGEEDDDEDDDNEEEQPHDEYGGHSRSCQCEECKRYRRYVCPVCSNRYIIEYSLNTHFMYSHMNDNNYNEMLKLDKHTMDGFPSFEVLEYMNMFSIDAQKDACSICCEEFSQQNTIINGKQLDEFSRKELKEKKELKELKENKELKEEKKEVEVKEEKKEATKKKQNKKRKSKFNLEETTKNWLHVPLKMRCCGKYICDMCLHHHVQSSNSIICPFCKNNHEKKDQEYIFILEDNDQINDNNWIDKPRGWDKWWNKHHLDVYCNKFSDKPIHKRRKSI